MQTFYDRKYYSQIPTSFFIIKFFNKLANYDFHYLLNYTLIFVSSLSVISDYTFLIVLLSLFYRAVVNSLLLSWHVVIVCTFYIIYNYKQNIFIVLLCHYCQGDCNKM